MSASAVETSEAPPVSPVPAGGLTRSGAARLTTLDALRGLVLVLMVLDHVRDFFHRTAFTADPLAMDSGDPALFATRWITHLCAPTFVFLAGVSIWLQKSNGKPKPDLSRFLVARGLWLILLELTIVGLGFNFGWWVFLQVIWAIGAGMVLMAGLIWLPRGAVLGLGIAVVLLHPASALISAESLGGLALPWSLLTGFTVLPASPAGFLLAPYPVIPWLGVMLLGYGLGAVFTREPGPRRRMVLVLALALLGAFLVLRGLNVFGADPSPWTLQRETLWSALSFLNVSKYPPSPVYVLVTLGVSMLLYLALDRLKGPALGVLLTFGRTPLFTYLLHIWIAHGLALLVGMAMGVPARAFMGSMNNPGQLTEAGWGFGLPGVYGFWLLTLLLLYPLSRWMERLKQRSRAPWLSYL